MSGLPILIVWSLGQVFDGCNRKVTHNLRSWVILAIIHPTHLTIPGPGNIASD
jgi:hypothetical protein